MNHLYMVEVAYASLTQVVCLPVEVAPGTTIRQAIEHSGILARCPEIDLTHNKVGVYGSFKDLEYPLNEGDRVEIYHPVTADPKSIRRQRAARQEPGQS